MPLFEKKKPILHPMQGMTFDLLEFWLNKVPEYERNPKYHDSVHRQLIQPKYGPQGEYMPTLVVLSGGEQSGKSMLGGAHVFGMHWHSKIIWMVGERYEDTRLEFQYMMESGIATGALDPKNISFPQTPGPARARFNNGCMVRTLSSADVTTLAQESPDGILMVEAGRQSYAAFRVLWGRALHHSAWFLVSGTFEQYKGRWFPDLWRACQTDNEYLGTSVSFPSYVNPRNYPLGERDPKVLAAKATLSEEEFAERFMGEPRAPIGVVFPEFRRHIHVKAKAELEPAYPVVLWIDPGYSPSSYAVLFTQMINDQVRIFDEIYVNGLENAQVAEMVKHHKAFQYINKIVIDVAAQSHAGAQQPAVAAWQDAMRGRGVVIRGQYVKVVDGINKTHDYLNINPLTNEPYMIINPKCESTINEFEEGYRRHVGKAGDVKTGMPIDANNHACKAIAYGLVDEYGYSQGTKIEHFKPQRRRLSYASIYRR